MVSVASEASQDGEHVRDRYRRANALLSLGLLFLFFFFFFEVAVYPGSSVEPNRGA